MRQINTVTGPLSACGIGMTLIHEHFLFGYPGWHGDITLGPFDREACVQEGIKMANRIKTYGVKTIVDATPNETGRDPELLKEIAEKTDLNIICSTGYYYERGSAPAYFKSRLVLGSVQNEIQDMFEKEITAGIGKTGIKAGVIKLASSRDAITNYEQMFFKAAVKVSKELSASIITHTQEGKQGPEQAELLIGLGADQKQIMIGHMCGSTDMDYMLRTLDQGVFIGFDRFGIEGMVGAPKDSRRVACLIGLIGLGYIDQIMISHDYVNYWLGRPGMSELSTKNYPTHIFEDVIPILKKGGITDAQINTMMVHNPQCFLTES